MQALMLLLFILAVALITVAVHVRHSSRWADGAHTTRCNAVLTHQSYADAGGVTHHGMWSHHGKVYDAAQNVEAKARDWICAVLSKSHHALQRCVLSDCCRMCGTGIAA